MTLRELWYKIIDTPIDWAALDRDINISLFVVCVVVLLVLVATLWWGWRS